MTEIEDIKNLDKLTTQHILAPSLQGAQTIGHIRETESNFAALIDELENQMQAIHKGDTQTIQRAMFSQITILNELFYNLIKAAIFRERGRNGYINTRPLCFLGYPPV